MAATKWKQIRNMRSCPEEVEETQTDNRHWQGFEPVYQATGLVTTIPQFKRNGVHHHHHHHHVHEGLGVFPVP